MCLTEIPQEATPTVYLLVIFHIVIKLLDLQKSANTDNTANNLRTKLQPKMQFWEQRHMYKSKTFH